MTAESGAGGEISLRAASEISLRAASEVALRAAGREFAPRAAGAAASSLRFRPRALQPTAAPLPPPPSPFPYNGRRPEPPASGSPTGRAHGLR
jgi:hypothetical protein